jgi:hypothetical protein
MDCKTLHSELLTKLLNRFLSRNEFFAIFEVPVQHHFLVIFGKFVIGQFPKTLNVWKTLFPNFLTQKQEIISELVSKLFLQNFREFKKPVISETFPNFKKTNFSETLENEKFFRPTQGLNGLLGFEFLALIASINV